MIRSRSLLAAAAMILAACSGGAETTSGAPTTSASAAEVAPTVAPRDPSSPHIAAPVREGSAIARGVGEAVLYIADEDHKAIRRVPLPLGDAAHTQSLELPGAPAQVLALDRRVLVTVRDPGMLLVLDPKPEGLVEKARIELPPDAWGIAVSADERLVLVSSAWSKQVSAIDLTVMKKLWSVEVPREPRGIALKSNGQTAYVSHLVGADLTRLDGLTATPKVTSIALPAAPLRAPSGVNLHAALGYAALLSPDESRLFVARHALGALGEDAWFGASTLDVLLTASDTALAPRRHGKMPFLRADKAPNGAELIVPGKPLSPFTQPRALALRKRTNTLLVASEGDDTLVEVDAGALDPTRTVLRKYQLGRDYPATLPVAATCAAPSGVALAEDELTAFVWCRASYDLAAVPLEDFALDGAPAKDAPTTAATMLRLADDPLEEAALGRRLFYNATDKVTSGGLGCAGCHPEGRDDGHVWHEAKFNTDDGTNTTFVGHQANIAEEEGVRGVPRRTPMLAGRVAAAGPYGWHAESPDLPARLSAGFGLHRWGGLPKHEKANLDARATHLSVFLRKGLVPPAALARELDANEQRGRELFESEAVGCSKCHTPATEYTDRVAYPLPKLPVRPGFDEEAAVAFKTPSLRWLAGRAPYLHDGRATSLEWLIDNNGDRMGKTSQLSAGDKGALIAFLRTL
jgi:cytochrome c peroxidase